jgi:hypothetical protein
MASTDGIAPPLLPEADRCRPDAGLRLMEKRAQPLIDNDDDDQKHAESN